ncbi:uncharacterized protein CMC5_015070 [Chondromyces crocatus]|uniref:Protein kinase domain-containing protein n=2 Tax=Chondromyces crocatus TaxID=52 RepID=A0A0K1E9L1_CHOCO|nr:uncharacterized protein CMC5_015070 [Chondromyces crocatus]
MQVAAGVVVGGKYRLEKPLSRGGMGAVWLARHVHLASPVAVKFMYASYATSPALLARFEREARIAANLQSPHVVHVHDYGFDAEMPYLVMELLQGEDLGTRLQSVGRVPLSTAVQLLTQIGRALRRAHEAGLVHRDLKPCNIFIARFEDEEIVKVLDFGIVKVPGSSIAGEATRPGELLGSPHYMSPEQVRGDADIDYRSDLWSLSVILFRALTGVLPFPGEQLGTVMAKILVEGVPKATDLAPDLPPMIDLFFEKGLSRAREKRFQSVRAMLDDLRAIAGHGPVSTRVGGSGSWGMDDITVSPPESPRGLCFDEAGWADRSGSVAELLPASEHAPRAAVDSPTPGTLVGAGLGASQRPAARGLSPVVLGTFASVLLISLGGGIALMKVHALDRPGQAPPGEVARGAGSEGGHGASAETTLHGVPPVERRSALVKVAVLAGEGDRKEPGRREASGEAGAAGVKAGDEGGEAAEVAVEVATEVAADGVADVPVGAATETSGNVGVEDTARRGPEAGAESAEVRSEGHEADVADARSAGKGLDGKSAGGERSKRPGARRGSTGGAAAQPAPMEHAAGPRDAATPVVPGNPAWLLPHVLRP